jgi:hypothetical protein
MYPKWYRVYVCTEAKEEGRGREVEERKRMKEE